MDGNRRWSGRGAVAMEEDGIAPIIEELPPDVQEKVLAVAEATGLLVRRRCCMAEMARATMCTWRHKPVTCSIDGTLPGLSNAQVVATYKRALDLWNDICGIGAVWTDNLAKANVYAHCMKIDGASGTLAWSYLVPCGIGSSASYHIEQRYDNTERWTVDWLLEVMLHELGHAWGLDHDTQHKDSLMYPYSTGGRILKPTQYEIDRMKVYGPPVIVPSPGPLSIQGGILTINGGNYVPVSPSAEIVFAGQRYKIGATKI